MRIGLALALGAGVALSGCVHETARVSHSGSGECLRIRSEHARLVGQAHSLSRQSQTGRFDKELTYRVNERYAIDVSDLDEAPGLSQSDRATRVVVNNRRVVYRDAGSFSDVSTRATSLDADISRLRVSYATLGCDRVLAAPVPVVRYGHDLTYGEAQALRAHRRQSVRWISEADHY